MPNDNELEFYEKQDAEHKAAVKAQAERYERWNGLEVQCVICKVRRADAVTGICEKCQDNALAVMGR